MVKFEPSFSENKSGVTEDEEINFVYKELSMTRRVVVAVLVTTLTFFLVYDRMAIDGVLLSLQQYFDINDSTTALLQTFQAISSALFFISIGMIGDRIERKRLVIMAVSIWFVLVFLSLVVGKGMFWAYLLLRTISSFAYAVVCSLGPVIVSDIFQGRARGYCLMALSIAPLIGSLLAMSISSWFLTSGYSWHAAMLISPSVVLPVTIALVFTMPKHEPILNVNKSSMVSLGFIEDIKSLLSVKTYALLVFGSTFSNLYQRAMSFWMPTILLYGYMANGSAFYFNLPFPVVMLITLLLGFTALLIGMPLSMWIAESWQQGKNLCSGRPFSRAIPLFVTLSTIIYSLISATAITMFVRAYPVYLACMFFNSLFTGGAAPLTTQIVLDVSPKWNRAAAMAIYNLFVGLADSPSSLIVGSLSDVFRGEATDPMSRYNAFVYALYILLGCNFISAALYGTATVFYPSDLAASHDDDMLSITSDEDAPLLKGALNRRASIVERGLLSRKATLDTTLL
ncbi:hypothetical protein PRIPAC_70639 [Pristionchus pacificus]|nr:hypothetical protein PRIPAC_70639 [Pristionchus pacificus]